MQSLLECWCFQWLTPIVIACFLEQLTVLYLSLWCMSKVNVLSVCFAHLAHWCAKVQHVKNGACDRHMFIHCDVCIAHSRRGDRFSLPEDLRRPVSYIHKKIWCIRTSTIAWKIRTDELQTSLSRCSVVHSDALSIHTDDRRYSIDCGLSDLQKAYLATSISPQSRYSPDHCWLSNECRRRRPL